MDLVFHTSGNDSNLHWSNEHPSKLGSNIQRTFLSHDQKITVGRVESRVLTHALPCSVNVHAETLLYRRIASTAHQLQTRHKVQILGLIMIERIPAKLVGDVVQLGLLVSLDSSVGSMGTVGLSGVGVRLVRWVSAGR